MEYLKYYLKYIIIAAVILLLCTMIYYYFYSHDIKDAETNKTMVTSKITQTFFVDVKGEINNPGVYEFIEGDRVIDAINIAGGITKKGSTANVNLSARLTNEMVVFIYSKEEVKNGSKAINCNTKCACQTIEVNNCIQKSDKSLVNINSASLEELLTLSGIGESKAKAIIEYREKNKFESITDLVNVSGIGETLFNSIKEYITV